MASLIAKPTTRHKALLGVGCGCSSQVPGWFSSLSLSLSLYSVPFPPLLRSYVLLSLCLVLFSFSSFLSLSSFIFLSFARVSLDPPRHVMGFQIVVLLQCFARTPPTIGCSLWRAHLVQRFICFELLHPCCIHVLFVERRRSQAMPFDPLCASAQTARSLFQVTCMRSFCECRVCECSCACILRCFVSRCFFV